MEPRRVAELVRVLLVVAATMAAGCTASPDASATIRVVNWWSSAGETDARVTLMGRFRNLHPGQKVDDTASADATAARNDIRQYWTQGRPPETFQANGGWDLLSWVLYDGVDDVQSKMEPIDQLASAWKSQRRVGGCCTKRVLGRSRCRVSNWATISGRWRSTGRRCGRAGAA